MKLVKQYKVEKSVISGAELVRLTKYAMEKYGQSNVIVYISMYNKDGYERQGLDICCYSQESKR